MDSLLELAARCEAATGPDRELDHLIEGVRASDLTQPPPISPVPRYTASLDAAMTLVPEWARWEIRRTNYHIEEGKAAAFVGKSAAVGSTPTLALCAAVLRARSQQDGGGE